MSLNKKLILPSLYICKKELLLFFSSPIAYLYLGVFVAVTLFVFFWGDPYFARNIADVRPMFEAMPILLIFLSSALTMRMWSEERRSGTLEHVLTLPISTWQFVQGKFAACKILLILALSLTLPLPLSIASIANLDWGPVLSGYLATILLGSAYIAIGLFVSSRSDNQIVSLILTVAICGGFYLLGSDVFTKLVNNENAELLRAVGSGSRFDSITRGVLDIRDFYYYISIAAIFLVLNRYSLEKDRWAADGSKIQHRRWKISTALIIANFLAFNAVLSPISSLRIDTTEGKIYSIGDATRSYISQLQEPLLIRGYFSAKTHPLLAPLVPEIQDLLKEYAAASQNKILLEFIDPATNTQAEEEAGSKYGIRPVPFRVADRYQSAVVNSYFNVLIQYGDEYKVLSFEELIEVKASGENDIEVKLRNPEYDITNALKQVLYAYQSGGNLFDSINGTIQLTAYVSADEKLPESLLDFNQQLKASLEKNALASNGKFSYRFVEPEKNDGAIAREIEETFGFQAMASSLFDLNSFYYYLVLSNNELAVQVSLPEEWNEEGINRSIDAGLKRFASGFTKTIGFVAPTANPYAAQMGQPSPASFNALQQSLNENMTAVPTTLTNGRVSEETDLLMVMAPENLDEKSVFAIDQYLMQGGTVILATSPYRSQIQAQGMSAVNYNSNLHEWLQHHGVNIENTFVMDTQNTAFPMPIDRQVGMFSVREISMLDYPYFIELREKGLNQKHPITSNLQQLTIPWASPITFDKEKNAHRDIIELAHSSPQSWSSSELDINPRINEDGSHGFNVGVHQQVQTLAAAISGRFQSFYAGKTSPLLNFNDAAAQESNNSNPDDSSEDSTTEEIISSVIERSPESARLIIVSSNSFAEDGILRVQSSMAGNDYVNPLQFMLNAADWSLEDEALLSIRSRSHFNRTLPPLSDKQRQFWELLNYGLALTALLLVFLFIWWRQQTRRLGQIKLLERMLNEQDSNVNHVGGVV